MITDEMLREAAARTCIAHTDEIIGEFDGGEEHVFSEKFERKIRKYARKAAHPMLYRSVQRVASVFLALLVGACVWLSVDAEARGKVMGWAKEIYGGYIVFHFIGTADDADEEKTYRPAWIPEGYSEYRADGDASTILQVYSNDEGKLLKVAYSYEPDETYWFIDVRGNEKVTVNVNGYPADLYISSDPRRASKIVWVDSNGAAFYVSGFLDKGDLIKIARNIREIKEK